VRCYYGYVAHIRNGRMKRSYTRGQYSVIIAYENSHVGVEAASCYFGVLGVLFVEAFGGLALDFLEEVLPEDDRRLDDPDRLASFCSSVRIFSLISARSFR